MRYRLLAAPVAAWLFPVATAGEEGVQPAIEEIVVTARKREERLSDAPVAVTALSGADLQRRRVDDLAGVRNLVPNLSVSMGDAANAIVYLRGVGQRDSLSFADPGVGIYLDDVYLGRAQGALLEVVDIERIEVLRGPQGTLYGRNTIGGAIKYVSAAPSPEPLFDLEGGLGDHGQRLARFTWSGPVAPGSGLLGRLTVAHASHDGYRDNTAPGSGRVDGDKDSLVWRGQAEFAPSDRWSLRVTVDGTDSDPRRSVTPTRVTGGPTLVAATAGKRPQRDATEVEADFNDLERLEVRGASLVADYAVSGHVAFRSITARREVAHATRIDLDGTAHGIFGVFVDQDQEQFSQEVQLSFTSQAGTRGLLGAYWFSEDDVTPDGIRNTEPIDFAFGGGFFLPYNTVSENDQSIEAAAVFGEVSWPVGPSLELTFGLRYTDETRRLRRKACQAFSAEALDIDVCEPPTGSLNPFGLRLDLEEGFSAVTPKLNAAYDSPAGLVYVNWARGFKSGGFDGRIGYNGAGDASAVRTQAHPYDPEFADTFEIGWKRASEDGSWRVAAALFYNDYTDLQLSSFAATPAGGFATVFTNAGEAETSGVEIELFAAPSESLQLNLSMGYLDARYEEFTDPTGSDVSGALTPINAPRWTANLGALYLRPLTVGRLEASADIAYRSRYHVDVNNLEALEQDGHALIGFSVALVGHEDRWRVSLSVLNASDEEYITHGFDLTAFPGIGLAYYGAPRTYALRVGYRVI